MDIRFDAVGFEYPGGIRALDGIELNIGEGSATAVIGANGSGKTTLLRHLDGLLRPTSGRVLIDGHDAVDSTVASLARAVGLAFQDPDLQIFGRTVEDEVSFGPRQLGRPADQRAAAVAGALRAVGLTELARVHPQDLGESGRKLLSIASVLAMQTPCVAFDEPTTGIDGAGIETIEHVVSQLRHRGHTVVAISHNLAFVAETFERVILLDAGRVILDGSPATVFAEPAWPTLRAAGLEPPAAALAGAAFGLGTTPSEASFIKALRAQAG